MAVGAITSTFAGTHEFDSASLLGSLDGLNTIGSNAAGDQLTIQFVPMSDGLNVSIYGLTRSQS